MSLLSKVTTTKKIKSSAKKGKDKVEKLKCVGQRVGETRKQR